jgi:hypothetical protein
VRVQRYSCNRCGSFTPTHPSVEDNHRYPRVASQLADASLEGTQDILTVHRGVDLRESVVEAENKKPTQRLMAVINSLEEDDATMAEITERDSYTGRWVDGLDRLISDPVEQVVSDNQREDRPTELSDEQHEQFVEPP